MENFSTIEAECAIILRFAGKLDFTNADELEKKIGYILEAKKNNLIINLADVTFISSSGIRVLMVSIKLASAQNLQVVFVGVNDKARHLLSILGLLDQILILESEKEALIYLRNPMS